MAYGIPKYGQKAANFGLKDYAGLGIAGSFGIISAIMADMRQADDASALFVINKWVASGTQLLGVDYNLPLYGVVLGLMGVGAASVFYFQPVTMRGAYAQGFGILAALMTLMPSDLGVPLDAPDGYNDLEELPDVHTRLDGQANTDLVYAGGSSLGMGFTDMLQPAVYQPAQAQPKQSQRAAATTGYTVELVIKFPNGLKREMNTMMRAGTLRGRLHNPATKKTYNIFRSSGAVMHVHDGNSEIHISTTVPGSKENTVLWVRLEAADYAIAVESFEAELGDNGAWAVDMKPSKVPLFVQRFGKSYWF